MSITTIASDKLSTKQKFERQYQLPRNADGTLRVSWITTIAFLIFHIGAVAALFCFSWKLLAATFLVHFVCIGFGIGLGYHRLHTHRSYKVPKLLEYFFAICGSMTLEGGPIFWVATHRKHHVLSDQEGDPHSPNEGFWWAHMLWFQPKDAPGEVETLCQRWAPDLYKDPVQRFFHTYFILAPIALGVVLYSAGEYFFQQGMSWMLWGLCFRMIAAYHSTWFVNSATHIWGYRNYETSDRSRNLWWVALLSYGEGWHNNHHAHQRLARHGHKWWEIDVTYMVIWTLKKVGLAKQVQDRLPQASPTA